MTVEQKYHVIQYYDQFSRMTDLKTNAFVDTSNPLVVEPLSQEFRQQDQGLSLEDSIEKAQIVLNLALVIDRYLLILIAIMITCGIIQPDHKMMLDLVQRMISGQGDDQLTLTPWYGSTQLMLVNSNQNPKRKTYLIPNILNNEVFYTKLISMNHLEVDKYLQIPVQLLIKYQTMSDKAFQNTRFPIGGTVRVRPVTYAATQLPKYYETIIAQSSIQESVVAMSGGLAPASLGDTVASSPLPELPPHFVAKTEADYLYQIRVLGERRAHLMRNLITEIYQFIIKQPKLIEKLKGWISGQPECYKSQPEIIGLSETIWPINLDLYIDYLLQGVSVPHYPMETLVGRLPSLTPLEKMPDLSIEIGEIPPNIDKLKTDVASLERQIQEVQSHIVLPIKIYPTNEIRKTATREGDYLCQPCDPSRSSYHIKTFTQTPLSRTKITNQELPTVNDLTEIVKSLEIKPFKLAPDMIRDIGHIDRVFKENIHSVQLIQKRSHHAWSPYITTAMNTKNDIETMNTQIQLLRSYLNLLHRIVADSRSTEQITDPKILEMITSLKIFPQVERDLFDQYHRAVQDATLDDLIRAIIWENPTKKIDDAGSNRHPWEIIDMFMEQDLPLFVDSEIRPSSVITALQFWLLTELKTQWMIVKEHHPTLEPKYRKFVEDFLSLINRTTQLNDITIQEVETLMARAKVNRQVEREPKPEKGKKSTEDDSRTRVGAIQGEIDTDGMNPDLVEDSLGDQVGYDD